MSLGSSSFWGEIRDGPILGCCQERAGEGALRPCPNGVGEGYPQLQVSFCPLGLLLEKGKRETKCSGGAGRYQAEAADFICATRMGIATLCSLPQAHSCLEPKLQ